LLRHGFVDDKHSFRTARLAVIEDSAAQETNAHRPEISWGHESLGDTQWLLARCREGTPFDENCLSAPGRRVQRQRGRGINRANTGERADRIHEPVEKAGLILDLGILSQRENQEHVELVRGVKSRVDAQYAPQTPE